MDTRAWKAIAKKYHTILSRNAQPVADMIDGYWEDLETINELRAEVAQLRGALTNCEHNLQGVASEQRRAWRIVIRLREDRERILDRLCEVEVDYCVGTSKVRIKDEGWRLYEFRWHKTRFGKAVKNKAPRRALIGVYKTRREALAAAIREPEADDD